MPWSAGVKENLPSGARGDSPLSAHVSSASARPVPRLCHVTVRSHRCCSRRGQSPRPPSRERYEGPHHAALDQAVCPRLGHPGTQRWNCQSGHRQANGGLIRNASSRTNRADHRCLVFSRPSGRPSRRMARYTWAGGGGGGGGGGSSSLPLRRHSQKITVSGGISPLTWRRTLNSASARRASGRQLRSSCRFEDTRLAAWPIAWQGGSGDGRSCRRRWGSRCARKQSPTIYSMRPIL